MFASSTYYKTLEDLEVEWREVEWRDSNDARFYIRKMPANNNNNNDCALVTVWGIGNTQFDLLD